MKNVSSHEIDTPVHLSHSAGIIGIALQKIWLPTPPSLNADIGYHDMTSYDTRHKVEILTFLLPNPLTKDK